MGTTKVLRSYKYHDKSIFVHKNTLKYLRATAGNICTCICIKLAFREVCGKETIWESAHFLPAILSAPKGEFFIYLDFSLELTPVVLWISGHVK